MGGGRQGRRSGEGLCWGGWVPAGRVPVPPCALAPPEDSQVRAPGSQSLGARGRPGVAHRLAQIRCPQALGWTLQAEHPACGAAGPFPSKNPNARRQATPIACRPVEKSSRRPIPVRPGWRTNQRPSKASPHRGLTASRRPARTNHPRSPRTRVAPVTGRRLAATPFTPASPPHFHQGAHTGLVHHSMREAPSFSHTLNSWNPPRKPIRASLSTRV
jgi:hypothetical protein